jgi:hypothetical protein
LRYLGRVGFGFYFEELEEISKGFKISMNLRSLSLQLYRA